MTDSENIGSRIRLARNLAEMSQEALAEKIGFTSFQQVSKYENNRAEPSLEKLREIAKVTDKPLYWFFLEEVGVYLDFPNEWIDYFWREVHRLESRIHVLSDEISGPPVSAHDLDELANTDPDTLRLILKKSKAKGEELERLEASYAEHIMNYPGPSPEEQERLNELGAKELDERERIESNSRAKEEARKAKLKALSTAEESLEYQVLEPEVSSWGNDISVEELARRLYSLENAVNSMVKSASHTGSYEAPLHLAASSTEEPTEEDVEKVKKARAKNEPSKFNPDD